MAIFLPRILRIAVKSSSVKLLTAQHDAALDNPQRQRKKPQYSHHRKALARSGLADKAEDLAWVDVERDVID